MTSFLAGLFAQQNFIPHGFCLAWEPALLGLHVISDSVVAFAYYTIPFALIYFISRRRDLQFRGIFALTGAFILACGTTHIMGVLTLWYPAYRLDGVIKLFTAVVSILTAAAMWWAMPQALALPSMAQLEEANRRLQHEIGERASVQAALRNANAELEQRVAARTAELEAEVAQRRRTEETLRASEQRWRSMFVGSAVGIALTDENQRFVAANDSFQKMIGYTEEELSSLGPVEITYEDDRETTRERLDDLLSGRSSGYQVEKRYRRKDGTVIWVRVSTALALEPGSNLRGIPTVIEDITERKRAEAEARESERRYREVEMELAHASRVATMGQLSASIAHEINQPITAAITNANAALRWLGARPPDLEEVRQALGRIVNDGNRAGEVISRVRDLIKKAPPRKDRLGINEAILEVVALTRSEVVKNRISVQTELAEGLPRIQGDRVQLQQVILNLIINAVEAMSDDEGSRELLISTGKAEPNGSGVLVAVRDSGPGLTPASIERLFEAFYTTKPDGMGMGLSICRSIIEAHGGRLWATANAPRGAVLQFALPLEPEESDPGERTGAMPVV